MKTPVEKCKRYAKRVIERIRGELGITLPAGSKLVRLSPTWGQRAAGHYLWCIERPGMQDLGCCDTITNCATCERLVFGAMVGGPELFAEGALRVGYCRLCGRKLRQCWRCDGAHYCRSHGLQGGCVRGMNQAQAGARRGDG